MIALLSLEAAETGDSVDTVIDGSLIDAEVVARYARCAPPRTVPHLLHETSMLAARLEDEADKSAARLEAMIAWSKGDEGGSRGNSAGELLDAFNSVIVARRANAERARSLRDAVSRAQEVLRETAAAALGDLSRLTANLKEAVLLARGSDARLIGLEHELEAVDAELGTLGLLQRGVAVVAGSLGLVGSELTDQRAAIVESIKAHEARVFGDAKTSGEVLVQEAAVGDPVALADVLEWGQRFPRAFPARLRDDILDLFSRSLATSAGAFLSIF
jgi:hypothetical protein